MLFVSNVLIPPFLFFVCARVPSHFLFPIVNSPPSFFSFVTITPNFFVFHTSCFLSTNHLFLFIFCVQNLWSLNFFYYLLSTDPPPPPTPFFFIFCVQSSQAFCISYFLSTNPSPPHSFLFIFCVWSSQVLCASYFLGTKPPLPPLLLLCPNLPINVVHVFLGESNPPTPICEFFGHSPAPKLLLLCF